MTGPRGGEVLVLRALGLGDALTAVPALRGLRRSWPRASITLAAPAALGHWMVDLGVVDRALATPGLGPLEWSGPRPDLAVNLHGRGPQSHRVLLHLRPRALLAFASAEAGVAGPRWRADEHEVDRWVRLVRSTGAECGPEDLWLRRDPGPRDGSVVLHPGAASPSRRWPVERWRVVADALARAGHEVVVTGAPAEAEPCAAVAAVEGVTNRCGMDDLAGLTARVGRASLVLCGDTGVAHLATAVRTPSVLLFGPVSPALWGPRVDSDLHRVLWEGPERGARPGDPHGAHLDPTLARITPDQVLEAAHQLLAAGASLTRPPRTRPLGTSAR